MAKLPEPNKKPLTTIDLIHAKKEMDQRSSLSKYIGAGAIGSACEREIWYKLRHAVKGYVGGRLLRLFETGNMAEDYFAEELRDTSSDDLRDFIVEKDRIGVSIRQTNRVLLHTLDPKTGKQFKFKRFSGHLGGYLDGIGKGFIEMPNEWVTVEMKTHSEKSFKKLKKEGVKKSKPVHYSQCQLACHWTNLKKNLYIAVNKNTDELYIEFIEYDPEHAKSLEDKALRVITSDAPPQMINESPGWHECNFCNAKKVCKFGAMPEVTCRTCTHSSPVIDESRDDLDSIWRCALHKKEMDFSEQLLGCEEHLYLPSFVSHSKVIVSGNSFGTWWVTYEHKQTGKMFRNVSPEFKVRTSDENMLPMPEFTSKELQHMDMNLLGDEGWEQVVSFFEATVIGESEADHKRKKSKETLIEGGVIDNGSS